MDGLTVVRGARNVASGAVRFARLAPLARPAVVNGVAGSVAVADGEVFSVMACTVRNGKIVEIDIVSDPARLARLGVKP